MQIVGRAIWLLAFVILCLGTVWATAALYIDLPATNLSLSAAILYLVVVLTILFFFKFRWVSLDWQFEVAEIAWAQIDGDEITIHNLRNFDYEPGLPAKPRWESKSVYLSQLRGVDLFINFWGSTLICHPIVSFQFGASDHVAISVETRMAKGQTYSTVRGFFKQFELAYIVADERDVIRVRTNYRHEQLYLYRTSVKPDRARRLFIDYLKTVDALHPRPQFYSALTSDCTTNVRMHTAATTVTGTGKQLWDFADTDFERASVSGPLFVQMRESVAQRSPGDPNHFPERAVHFHK